MLLTGLRRRAHLWLMAAASLYVGYRVASDIAVLFVLRKAAPFAYGRDFLIAWTAGHMLHEGGLPAAIFHPDLLWDAARRFYGPHIIPHLWPYPPPALFIAWPLGFLPYGAAYLLWVAGGALICGAAVSMVTRRWGWALLVLVSPPALFTIEAGQNGYFTAALLFAGFAATGARSGAALGLLTLKPHLGLMAPVFLAAERRWKAFAVAALVGVGLVLASLLAFGVEPWRVWSETALPAQTAFLQKPGLERIIVGSPFMWVFDHTERFRLAMALQGVCAILAATFVWSVGRHDGDPGLKLAAVLLATMFATPQIYAYDMIPLAVAAVLLITRSGKPIDLFLATLLWGAPILLHELSFLRLPLVPAVIVAAAARVRAVILLTAQRDTLRERLAETDQRASNARRRIASESNVIESA